MFPLSFYCFPLFMVLDAFLEKILPLPLYSREDLVSIFVYCRKKNFCDTNDLTIIQSCFYDVHKKKEIFLNVSKKQINCIKNWYLRIPTLKSVVAAPVRREWEEYLFGLKSLAFKIFYLANKDLPLNRSRTFQFCM